MGRFRHKKDKSLGELISFLARNWRVLGILFTLGGMATVLSVVPGMAPVKQTIETGIETAKAKVVSVTEAVAP